MEVEVCKNIPERNCSGIFDETAKCDSYVHAIGNQFALLVFNLAMAYIQIFSLQ